MTVIQFRSKDARKARTPSNQTQKESQNMGNVSTPPKNTSPWVSNEPQFTQLVGKGKANELRVSLVAAKGGWYGMLIQTWYLRHGRLQPGGGLSLWEDEWKALFRELAARWGWAIDEAPPSHDSHDSHDSHIESLPSPVGLRVMEADGAER